MSLKPLMFLSSALATASMVAVPAAAQAGGMSQIGTWNKTAGKGAGTTVLDCGAGIPMGQPISMANVLRPSMVSNNISVNHPLNVSNSVNGGSNVSVNRPMNVQSNTRIDRPLNVQNN